MDLNGKMHRLVLTSHNERSDRDKSQPHSKALSLLLEIFPDTPVFEEMTIPGNNHRMYLDIFLPKIPLAVEVHGQQHYKFTPFFHKSKAEFLISCRRDRDKQEWCRINLIPMAILPYDQEHTWSNLISLAISPGLTI